MKTIHLTGDLQELQSGLNELSADLGVSFCGEGLPVDVQKGNRLEASLKDGKGQIVYQRKIEFFRALSLFVQHMSEGEFSIQETPCFDTVGLMFDVSRNAVLTPENMKFFLRKMALMGMNLGMLYTEDTYEVKDYPYFGYMRGRYSYEDIKGLDDYAFQFGIELMPCIQTLGHLERALRWPKMQRFKDTEEVLLAGDEDCYQFIEAMIAAASAPYRSKRIHIGMDEAWDLGLGRYLRENGYHPGFEIIEKHLARVREIANRHGLRPMMWSDMYFRLSSPTGGYYDSGDVPKEVVESAPADVDLVYWDYAHDLESEYDEMLKKHAPFAAPTIFAGGLWTWCGMAPDYDKATSISISALNQCRKHGVKEVLATAWGDNGAECNLQAALYGLQLYAEFCYTGRYDEIELDERFAACTGANPHSFRDLTLFNSVPGMNKAHTRPVNAAKFLLYQDPLIPLFEKDTENANPAVHFQSLAEKYKSYKEENPEFSLMFGHYEKLARALALKCEFHQKAGPSIRAGSREEATALAGSIPSIIQAVEELKEGWREMWYAVNRPFGFEIIDLRLGGIIARLQTAQHRLEDYAAGRIDDIPELSSEKLPYTLFDDGALNGSYAWSEIVSACKIDK